MKEPNIDLNWLFAQEFRECKIRSDVKTETIAYSVYTPEGIYVLSIGHHQDSLGDHMSGWYDRNYHESLHISIEIINKNLDGWEFWDNRDKELFEKYNPIRLQLREKIVNYKRSEPLTGGPKWEFCDSCHVVSISHLGEKK